MKDLSKTISHNLAALRKARGLTQGQLAEEFSYTDKSISKWETGEGLPDINVLSELASFYGVTVDYLLNEHLDEELKEDGRKNPKDIKRNKIIVAALAVVFVWTIAACMFSALMLANVEHYQPWLIFIWALPLSILTLLFISVRWAKRKTSLILTIALFWALALALYLEIGFDTSIGWNFWFIWLIPIPATVCAILVYYYRLDRQLAKH